MEWKSQIISMCQSEEFANPWLLQSCSGKNHFCIDSTPLCWIPWEFCHQLQWEKDQHILAKFRQCIIHASGQMHLLLPPILKWIFYRNISAPPVVSTEPNTNCKISHLTVQKPLRTWICIHLAEINMSSIKGRVWWKYFITYQAGG